MNDDQFAKLFKYMQDEFAALHKELETKADRRQVERVYNLVDKQTKQQEIDEHERLAMKEQLERHEDWIFKRQNSLN